MNTNEEPTMVHVIDAPGYAEFTGNLVRVVPAVDDRGDLGVIRTTYGSIYDLETIPMKYVHTV